jgi:hypothetical protein
MTDAKRPRDDLDKTLESIELASTLESGDSVAPPADLEAAKSVAKIPADLSEPECVHNMDDLESMLDDFGSSPGVVKQEPTPLAEEIDAAAETIATLAGNRGMGNESTVEDEVETVETAAASVDNQQEESDSQGRGEKAKTAATGLDDSPSVKQNSAARPTGRLPLFGLLLGLLGIAAGLGAGYYAYLLQGKLAVLDQRVEATVQAPPPPEEAPAEVTRLQSRVEEVATLIEESSHMHDSSGEEIDSLKSRIAKMEQEIDGLRDNAADRSPATEVQTPGLASAARISSVPEASNGSWAVNFESHTSEKTAAAAVVRLRSQGINAEKYAHIKDGTTWYRIRVPGFSTSAEAREYAENILAKSGFSQAWISRMQ